MIISIGVDCGLAGFLRDNKLHPMSLPFDWVVTYNGFADICLDIKNIKSLTFSFIIISFFNKSRRSHLYI